MLKILFILFLLLLFLVCMVGFYRTYKSQHSRNATTFRDGKLPNPSLDGTYTGSVTGYKGAWGGKTFYADRQEGINNFGDEQRYPFRTTTGKGLRDKNTDVVKIDYNLPVNPFWVRLVLDEVVEIEPDHYLGKIHFRFIPGLPFTIGYFRLNR